MTPTIESISTPSPADRDQLAALLRDAVEGGASVGFMLPVRDADMTNFWDEIFTDVRQGRRGVLVARLGGQIVGTVQLAYATKPNSTHRAEVQKLLVLRSHRSRGIGAALLEAVEPIARANDRTLLHLDTSATGNALGLYHRCGYTRVGAIPRYARDPDGPFIDTVIYFKDLTA